MSMRKVLAMATLIAIVPASFIFVVLQMFGRWLDGWAGPIADRLIASGEQKAQYIMDQSET